MSTRRSIVGLHRPSDFELDVEKSTDRRASANYCARVGQNVCITGLVVVPSAATTQYNAFVTNYNAAVTVSQSRTMRSPFVLGVFGVHLQMWNNQFDL